MLSDNGVLGLGREMEVGSIFNRRMTGVILVGIEIVDMGNESDGIFRAF